MYLTSVLIWQVLNFVGILLLIFLVLKLIKRKNNNAKIISLPMGFILTSVLFFSCIDTSDKDQKDQLVIDLINEYGLNVDKIDKSVKLGLIANNLYDLENSLKWIKNLDYDSKSIEDILIQSGLEFSSDYSDSIWYSTQIGEKDRILCVQNAHLVNARIGISPFTTLNVNFFI